RRDFVPPQPTGLVSRRDFVPPQPTGLASRRDFVPPQPTAPEFWSTISDEVSTATKAEAGMVLNSSMSPEGQLPFCSPWKYHADPLSASTSPYVCMAAITRRAWVLKPAVENPASRRNRAPIGG